MDSGSSSNSLLLPVSCFGMISMFNFLVDWIMFIMQLLKNQKGYVLEEEANLERRRFLLIGALDTRLESPIYTRAR